MDELERLKRKLVREQSARKQAEQILEDKSRELYRVNEDLKALYSEVDQERFKLFETSSFGVALTLEGKLVNVNSKFCDMMGYTKEEILNLSIKDLTFEDDVKVSYEKTEELQTKKIDHFKLEKRYRRQNGTMFWGKTEVNPVFKSNGEIKYHLAVIENIQAQKNAEEYQKALIKELKRSNEELETFAQMVSHDLKSPLKGVITLIDWLKTEYVQTFEEETASEYINQIDLRLTKMTNLIDGIINYTKLNEDLPVDTFNVETVIDHVINFIYRPENIRVIKKGSFPKISATKTKIEQLFQNLIVNAIKFQNKENGLVEIIGDEDRNYYIFKIKDNGKGIESKYFSKIFNVFSSIDSSIENSGIGLAIVKKIVEDYGGKIFVESEINQGSTFTFSLKKSRTNA